jgi:acetylornithine deacetylase/succinyl-diaminopimelate desuccinylase-like protein
MINGGHSENMQPDRCKIVCDARTLPPQTTATVIADIEAMLAGIKRGDPEFEAEVELVHDAPYSFIPGDSPIVQEVQRAVVEVTGKPVEVLVSPATSDTRWLTLFAKIPTCKFSFTTVGSGPNERIRVTDYMNMIRVYAMVTLNMLYAV